MFALSPELYALLSSLFLLKPSEFISASLFCIAFQIAFILGPPVDQLVKNLLAMQETQVHLDCKVSGEVIGYLSSNLGFPPARPQMVENQPAKREAWV